MEGGIGFRRLDYLLSTWLFVWWLLYYYEIVKYNPKLFIILATIVDILLVLYGIIYVRECSLMYWILTIVFGIVTKFIPYNDLESKKDSDTSDIIFGVVLSFIYLVWVTFNGLNPNQVYSSQLRGW